ncbi:hypothetical protein ERX46_08360 [Brumimicrobium glaciale]|uniref:GNAT family N-acetyltransferase n=1 Tax=Brumimicrobium glaciale TaxID=200475 RepID=A0A4Q4KPN5_9FLAO|nr:hypothetical protein [Brumimicrobium glaciale]RYM33969.1 hypothetical protein ERX46_08360 [Brumimicrobium glaciale]
MKINPPFVLRESYNDDVLELLKSVTLGSNGARYQHQRLEKRIKQVYRPLFLNLERNGKVLGNITFCRRPKNWYVRYFAFDLGMQATNKQPKSKATNSGLKSRIGGFFESAFELEDDNPDLFYAYIDPRNERSLWMSQNFDFYTVAKIATQSFSRVKPKNIAEVAPTKVNDFIREKIEETYGKHPLFFTKHTFNDDPFYTLTINGEVVALAKTHSAEWKITRLPGRNGTLMRNIIPFVPGLRKVIRPNSHVFTVVDSIWCKEGKSDYLEKLFEGILFQEKTNTIIWWVDEKEPLYKSNKDKVNWGLLNKVNGVQDVDLVIRTPKGQPKTVFNSPTYITGFDFI